MAEGEWCLIESDPSIFTELIAGYGVSGLQVEELYSLDDDSLAQLRRVGPSESVLDSVSPVPVHGIIFLFRWHKEEKPAGSLVLDDRRHDIFFAKQVIPNACATQALLSVLLNTSHKDVDLGQELSEFKTNTFSFDPGMKGLSLTNMDSIRKVHNSFSRQTLVEFDPSVKQKDEDPFHFVAYVPIGDTLYELDGLQEGPLELGKITNADWLQDIRPILQTRMEGFMGSEIRFNLMAIMSSKSKYIGNRMQELGVLESTLTSEDDMGRLSDEIQQCALALDQEAQKLARYKVECVRHRHNYVPLIMEILKILGQKGELVPMVEEAKERRSRKRKAEDRST